MTTRTERIEDFFESYELFFNSAIADHADVKEEIARSFASHFIESGPDGVVGGNNDDQFLKKIHAGFQFHRAVGSTGMMIMSKVITLLDDWHALVKIDWRYGYERDNTPGSLDFHIFYLVTTDRDVRIITYLAGDEQRALKEKGLIPERETALTGDR